MNAFLISTNIEVLWKKIFQYLRTLECSHEEAEDLAQEVFLHLTEKGFFEGKPKWFESPDEGRNYLFAMARNVLRDRWRRDSALKRGGRSGEAPLDELSETVLVHEETTPAEKVQQVEAEELLEQQLASLERRAIRQGKHALFIRLEQTLRPGYGPANLRETARSLGLAQSSVRVQAHRWRKDLLASLRASFDADLAA